MKYIDCCNDCGSKRYNIKREAHGITIHMDICPICGERKMIIPGMDWAWMCGETDHWD